MGSADECGPLDLSELSDEEKDDLIHRLHDAYHQMIDEAEAMRTVAVNSESNMVLISEELAEGDKLGSRSKAIKLAVLKSRIMATLTLMQLGVDFEQVATDQKFEDIVSDLDLDGTR